MAWWPGAHEITARAAKKTVTSTRAHHGNGALSTGVSSPDDGLLVYNDRKENPSMAALDWSLCPAVESIPGKVSGAWVLKGTRMPVSVIFENLKAGANIDDIMEWFEGLDREQVEAVIEFAARSLDVTPSSPVTR